MKHFLGLLIVAASLAMPLCAHADTLTTFYITDGTFQSGGTFSGSLVLDTTTDQISSGTIRVDADGFDLNVNPRFEGYSDGPYVDFNFDGGHAAVVLQLSPDAVAPTLCVASTGKSVCPYKASYISYNNGDSGELATAGTISTTPGGVTPEPSSLVLLGTGALGLAGAVRRRIVRA